MTIGEAVRMAMLNVKTKKNMSLAAIVDNSKVTEAAISQAIIGVTKNPSILTIHEFCCGTGYTLEEFFARSEFDDLE